MSKRTEQVSSMIKRGVQDILAAGLSDPRIKGSITVTKVTCAEDLKIATVYVSVSPAKHEPLTLHGLEAAARHIRRLLSEDTDLALPQLQFRVDTQFKRQADVLEALSKVREERDRLGDPTPPTGSPPTEAHVPNDGQPGPEGHGQG